jgi:hypothetical protein
MIKCEICGRAFENFKGISMHVVKTHKIKVEEYYLKYINHDKGICKICGNDTTFISIYKGYREYCSLNCSNNCEEVISKRENTCLKNYGVRVPYKSEEIRNRGKLTCLENNGVENPMQSEEIRNKSHETCLKNNGVKHPYQNEEIRNKGKLTCLENNGFENPTQNEEILKKIKLNFSNLLKKFPELVKIENLIEAPNGDILGHCKNANCHNSVEQGCRFVVTTRQIYYRNIGINSISDGNYFYCCEECKKDCVLFNKSSRQLDNIFNQEELSKASPQDLSIWRNEVFIRQLKDNQLHKENFCEICHETENLVGHHILPQKLYPEFALDPINGVILCSKCHTKHGHTKGTECSTGNLANKICK